MFKKGRREGAVQICQVFKEGKRGVEVSCMTHSLMWWDGGVGYNHLPRDSKTNVISVQIMYEMYECIMYEKWYSCIQNKLKLRFSECKEVLHRSVWEMEE